MDKKTRKELERLENLTSAEKRLLGNLYGDLFGSLITDPSGSSSEKGASGFMLNLTGSPTTGASSIWVSGIRTERSVTS